MKISQREARRLRKRVAELERVIDNQRNAWAADYINGTHLVTVERGIIGFEAFGMLAAARKLKHAVVINAHSDGVKFYALPLKGAA